MLKHCKKCHRILQDVLKMKIGGTLKITCGYCKFENIIKGDGKDDRNKDI